MNIQLAQMPESVESAEILIMIYSGNNYTSASATIKSGEWNRISISLESFEYSKNTDKIKIFVRGSDGLEDIGNPTLIISDIQGLSSEFDSKYLSSHINHERTKFFFSENFVNYDSIITILSSVIISAALIEVLHILIRVKRNKQNGGSDPNGIRYTKM